MASIDHDVLAQATGLRQTLDMLHYHVETLPLDTDAKDDVSRILSPMREAAWDLERGLHDGVDLASMPRPRALLFYGLPSALNHARDMVDGVLDDCADPDAVGVVATWPLYLCEQIVETALDFLA
jgi:hypothetical protein